MMWIILLALICVVAVAPVVSSCPKNLQNEINYCLRDVKGYTNEIGAIGMLQSDLEKTAELCSGGSIQKAFECLNRLYNRCAKTKEGSRDLDLAIDANKWRDAMSLICDNIIYLSDYPVCENRVKVDFNECAKEQLKQFRSQQDELKDADMTEAQRRAASIDITCLNTDKVLHCLKSPIERYCPNTMTTLLIKIVKSFTPNICANKIPTIGGSQYDTQNKGTGSGKNKDSQSKFLVEVSSLSESEEVKPKSMDVPYREEEEDEVDDDKSKASKNKDEIKNTGVVGTAKKQQSKNGAPMRQAGVAMSLVLSFLVALSTTFGCIPAIIL